MSAINTKSNEIIGPLGASADKNKQWQRELLMERLRTHQTQTRTFPELSKAMRMSMLEKRYSLDPTERSNLQKCLDSMQHCIKVTTRQGLVERLESLSRQLGLKFMEDTSGLFISSDMFYLEIVLDAAGTLSDVKVHHEGKIEQQSCSELVTCLLKGDFADFTAQLEGLSSIYKLNAEAKVKSKAFVALQAMETDLYSLYASQNFHTDALMVLHESAVGIVQKRRGGHPMRLTYFVSPYDLLCLETKSMLTLSIDLIATQQNIGMSVSVNLEPSGANKLQILPIVTVNAGGQGVNVPIFVPITAANSMLLPATFVLRLNRPIPICDSLVDVIATATEQSFGEKNEKGSVMELIVQNASNGELRNGSRGLFVTLPDQNHCYFFTENRQLKGTVISSIPFTEPSHVPKILGLLRRQALFHTLLASCVRPESKMGDLESTTMLEVSAINIDQISVALEHPFEESMATIEIDLRDAANIECRIFSLTNNYDTIASKLSKIIDKTLSIPIAVRALLKFWDQEQMKGFHRGNMDNGNFSLPLGPSDPGGRPAGGDFRDVKPKMERGMNGGAASSTGAFGAANNSRQFFHSPGENASGGFGDSSNAANAVFETAGDSAMINQQFAAMKTNHEGGGGGSGFVVTAAAAAAEAKEPSGGEDFYKSPKSRTDLTVNQNSSETSDSSSLGTSTSTSDLGVASLNFNRKNFPMDSDSNSQFIDGESSRNSADLKTTSTRIITPPVSGGEKSASMDEWRIKDTDVSIMPVNPTDLEIEKVLSDMGLERRPGIEIIPITAATTQSLPSSITITPITSSKSDRKSSSSRRHDEKSRSDKKRKRRKEDSSPMGPPDKILSKQDALNRPVSVSIKTTDGMPLSPSGLLRKFSSSGSKSSSGRPSPKQHSPSHISPKHGGSGTSSPKPGHYSNASPKHSSSSGSSGKPSMSALKNAATNASPKSDKSNSSKSSSSSFRDKDRDRDRERNSSSSSKTSSGTTGSNSPKIKSSTVKLKQIDLSAALLPSTDHFIFDEMAELMAANTPTTDPLAISKPLTSPTNSTSGPNKVRKGSLSAVIDKLKSAQNTADEMAMATTSQDPLSTSTISRDKIITLGGSSNSSSSNKILYNSNLNNSLKTVPGASLQNSEYMIKPSLDGMKITINKTRTKDSLFSGGGGITKSAPGSSLGSFSKIFLPTGSGSGGPSSPKRHTGLKPGVNSGPASKKTQNSQSISRSSSNPAGGRSNTFQKSNSSGSLSSSKSPFSYSSSKSMSSSSLSGTVASAIDPLKKDKAKVRNDASDVMKMLGFPSPMDGFMKSLNTKFQIPKLSARTTDDTKKDSPNRSIGTTATTTAITSPVFSTAAMTVAAANVSSSMTATSASPSPKSAASTITITTSIGFNEGSKPSLADSSASARDGLGPNKNPPKGFVDGLVASSFDMLLNNASNKFPSSYYAATATTTNPLKHFHDAQNSTLTTKPTLLDTQPLANINTTIKDILPKQSLAANSPLPMPINMISPPYTPPTTTTSLTNSKPSVLRTTSAAVLEAAVAAVAAAASAPALQTPSDELIMRPPSAPGATVADTLAKSTELDPMQKTDSTKSDPIKTTFPSSGNPVTTIATSVPLNMTTSSPAIAAARKIASTPVTALNQQHKINYPPSPSVSVHIVKSPVPSPLMVLPSPHSNSPCITDDELMDEALIGIGSK